MTAGLLLGMGSLVFSGPLPRRAVVFWEEFERTGQTQNQVSLQERVVFSLLQAAEHTEDHPQHSPHCI